MDINLTGYILSVPISLTGHATQNYSDAFLPPFAGAFVGVLLAFIANFLGKSVSDKRSRLDYVKLFRQELDQALTTLQTEKKEGLFEDPLKEKYPSIIQLDGWTSAINNGDLRLFRTAEINLLSGTYSTIRNYNETIEFYKNISTFYGRPIGENLEETSGYYLPRKLIGELSNKSIAGILKIKDENWMKSNHWWQY